MRSRTSSGASSSSSHSDDDANATVIRKGGAVPNSADHLKQAVVKGRDGDDLSGDSDDADIEFLYEQNFYELRARCLREKRLFEDPEFPADNDLLRQRSARHLDDLDWLRPHDFLRPDDPVLVSERNEGFDIRVGLDSWFVPAMSAIAESEALLRRVVPADQGFDQADDYAGIFHFRFWFGRWIEIVVDDRLPCKKGSPLYMRSSRPEEMWPALLEKAYAKAKGSYELLNHWLPIDGCIEMTGGVPERVRDLPELLTADGGRVADALWADISRATHKGNIVLVRPPIVKSSKKGRGSSGGPGGPALRHVKLCMAEARQLGLETKYSYRVTQVVDLGDGRQLVRVKNCSGPNSVKWVGAWHPEDTRWANVPAGVRHELQEDLQEDGGFWMAYGDFLKYFQTLDICHLSQDVDHVITFHGRWEVGLNAGGVQKADFRNFAKNPQCFIGLKEVDSSRPDAACAAVISLMQRREPKSRAKGLNKIGFKVYRVDESTEELTAAFFSYKRNDGFHKCVAKTPTWQDGRETNIRVRLPPAKYCIVPCTFVPEQEGDFILRVHIERPAKDDVVQKHAGAKPITIEDVE